MTTLSPTMSIASQSENKGSNHGKATSSSSSYSFQQFTGSCGSVYSNRVKVLSSETLVYPSEPYGLT